MQSFTKMLFNGRQYEMLEKSVQTAKRNYRSVKFGLFFLSGAPTSCSSAT